MEELTVPAANYFEPRAGAPCFYESFILATSGRVVGLSKPWVLMLTL